MTRATPHSKKSATHKPPKTLLNHAPGMLLAPSLLGLLLAFSAPNLHSEEFSAPAGEMEGEEDELFSDIYGDEEMVSIASGVEEPIYKAPSIASVITRNDLDHWGVLTLEEALEMVSGVHVSRYILAYNPIYIFRGIQSDFNQQVLLLIDGQPMTRLFNRERGTTWGDLPTANVARIEIIHGPGSAIYGADAYAGVINVITMDAENGKTAFGVRAGNENTTHVWLNNAFTLFNQPAFFSAEYRHSDGRERLVEADGQTFYDAYYGTSASFAPGNTSLNLNALDLRLKTTVASWKTNLGVQIRDDIGAGLGSSSVLDPTGSQSAIRTNLILSSPTYSTPWAHLTTHSKISYAHSRDEQATTLFPPGTRVSYGGPEATYPEGLKGSPESREWSLRLEQSLLYSGWAAHDIRFDLGIDYGELYDVQEHKNFDAQGQPLEEGFVDVSNDPSLVYILPRDQWLRFMLLQDRWHIAADFDATLGVRIDDYGHFGTSTNPRASLVWQASHDTTLKFLYGRAFRAPSFVERYIINNPVILGQPTLKPETIDSFDISLIKRINFSTRLQVNLFRSQLTDFVETAQNNATQLIFINGEKRDNYGLEIEYEREFQFDGKLVANYAHQKVESDATGASLGKYPHNNGSVRFTHGFENQWRYSIIWNWVSSRARAPGDFREKLEGYHTADITLSRMLNNESSLSLLIKNVANADLREPSTLGIFLPNDLPTGKRLALLELKLHDF